jgi:hypothetical protein
LRKAVLQIAATPDRRHGDKIKRDVVVRRLTFFRCRAAFNQVERTLPRWICPIVISFALLKSQIGVFAEGPGI